MKKEEIINGLLIYLGVIFTFTCSIMRARIFTPQLLGEYNYILTVSAITSIIFSCGIPQILLRYNHDENLIYKIMLKVQILIYILGLIIFIIFMKNFKLKIIDFLFITSISFLNFLNMSAILTKNSIKNNFYQKILLGILDIIGILILNLIGWISIEKYLYYVVFIRIITSLIIFFSIKNNLFLKTNISLRLQELKIYFKYGLTFMLNSLGGALITGLDKLILKKLLNYRSIGIYSIAFTIGNILGLVGSLLITTIPREISGYLKNENYLELEKIYKYSTKVQIYIGSYIFLYLFCFSKNILSLLGEDYSSGYIALKILLIGHIFNLSTGFCGTIIGLSKYYYIETRLNLILVVITVLTNYIFITRFGMNGAAIATSLGVIIINIYKVYYVYLKFKILPFDKDIYKIMLGVLVVLLFYFIIEITGIFSLFLAGLFGIVFYELSLYIIKFKNSFLVLFINKILIIEK